MKDNNSLTDEQLISDIRSSKRVADEIVVRYKDTVRIKAAVYTSDLAEFDDLYQEGMLGLLSAIAHYSSERNTSFKTYADRCIENRMKNAVKRASKLPIITESVERTVIDVHNRGCVNPEDVVASREDMKAKAEKIRNVLSPLEAEIFDLFLRGYTYEQLAEHKGITFKAVDNALFRVRRKLKSIF